MMLAIALLIGATTAMSALTAGASSAGQLPGLSQPAPRSGLVVGQVIDAGITEDQLVTFKYEDQGVATLEDGLYVLEDRLADPAFQETMVKFVRASMKGWKYAEANPDEAAMIVLENDQTGAQTESHQKRMMGEIAKLTAGSNGALDVAAAERTVATLMAGGSDPVITKAPEGAWTSAITDKALAQ